MMRRVGGKTGIKGLDIVIANLNKAINKMEGVTIDGLIESAILIRRETETTPPLTPVDLGNLRASWFVVVTKKGFVKGKNPKFVGKKAGEYSRLHSMAVEESKALITKNRKKPTLVMGYSVNYAAPVHEKLGARNWKRDNSGPKWFQRAIENNKREIVNIIRSKIKGL